MKNNKERLFEVMSKVNPDFRILNEDTVPPQNIPQNPDFQLKTYGDLKKAINVIKLKQKGSKLGGIGVDVLLNSIPFLGNAKTAYDIYKAAFSRPDNKKTNTWLDKLDIDDKTSSIVDDTVENGFITAMANMFNSETDDKLLEPNFDMNAKLVDYLARNYDNRTVKYVASQE